jgi:type IV fimbrial biogenesis protein FimT
MSRPIVQSGFTLIELMVTISIVAILLTIGVPSLRGLIADQRVRVAASDLTSEIAYTRANAVASSRNTIIQPLSAGNWQSGWRIYTDVNGDGAYTAGTDLELKRSPPPQSGVLICTNVGEFANNIIFQPDGRVVRTSANTANDGITVSQNLGSGNLSDIKIRTLYFGPSGRISVIQQNGGTNGGGVGLNPGGSC